MNSIKLVLVLFSFFLMKNDTIASGLQFQNVNDKDSIVLLKYRSEWKEVIKSGEKVKLWLTSKTTEVGRFKSLRQDSLILLSNGIEKIILVNDIEKIKVYAGSLQRGIGSIFTIVGAGGMAFGGISLVAGIAALFSDKLGAVILIAVPVLLGGGFGVYKIGDRIRGKKYDLRSDWSIDLTQ